MHTSVMCLKCFLGSKSFAPWGRTLYTTPRLEPAILPSAQGLQAVVTYTPK